VEVLRFVLWSSVSPTDIIEQDAATLRWVFSVEAGEPVNPSQFSYRFRQAVAASDLLSLPLEGLRHTPAAFLLSAGVPAHTFSARLEYADQILTMNVQAHCPTRAQ
jgi:hypothetical protein